MRTGISLLMLVIVLTMLSCKNLQTELNYEDPAYRIIFLHHSTGNNVWYGDVKQEARFRFRKDSCMVPRLLKSFNDRTGNRISIVEKAFPSGEPYPWKNYPYDYYNILVKNGGENAYMGEPTLEMLTKEYNMIIFKFCFPYSKLQADDSIPDVNSEKKTISNYKLQYNALKDKMHEFPSTQFLVWTGAALTQEQTTPEEAARAAEINLWVKEEWDEPGDNIELFDFRQLETGGALYLQEQFAVSEDDSHPNMEISTIAAGKLVDRITEILKTKDLI